MLRILFPALLILLAGAPQARAKELKILTGAGMSLPVRQLATAFGAARGDTVTLVSDTAGGVQKRIEAGESFDLVIATTTVMDALAQDGKVPAQHHDLARMVAGIGMKAGSAPPAIGDMAALRRTLLAADSIAYVDPASGGITGVFFLAQADRMGIGEQVRAHAVLQPNGTGVADAVAAGQAQYGVTLISEMLPNKDVFVWPLPDAVQMTTLYAGAVTTDAQNAMDAAALLDELRGPKGRDAAAAAGLKPVLKY